MRSSCSPLIACLSGNFYEAYSYDKLGNILSKAGTTYTYGSSKPQAVTAAGTNSYSYDNNGNMTTGAGRTFTWNGENQPVQIAKVGTPTETYAYDGDTVRIKKAVWGTTTDVSVYVGKVEYRGSQVISTYGGVASRTTTGNPTSTNRGTLVYMHSDHLGSVSMTTSATGSIAQTQNSTHGVPLRAAVLPASATTTPANVSTARASCSTTPVTTTHN